MIKKNKKGQVIGQVFIYMISAILIGFIVIIGYNAINTFRHQTNQIEKVKFVDEFTSLLDRMTYLDLEIKSFNVPQEYKQICFTANELTFPISTLDLSTDKINPLMLTQWENTENNVYLISGITSFYSFKVRDLRLDSNEDNKYVEDLTEPDADNDPNYLCIPSAQGGIKLRIENKGKYIFISPNISDEN